MCVFVIIENDVADITTIIVYSQQKKSTSIYIDKYSTLGTYYLG